MELLSFLSRQTLSHMGEHRLIRMASAAAAGEVPKQDEATPPPTEVTTATPKVNDRADTPASATVTVQEAATTGVAATKKKIDLIQTAKAGADWIADKFGYKPMPTAAGTESAKEPDPKRSPVRLGKTQPSPEGQPPSPEGTPDQLKKAPETYSEQLSQRFDKVMEDFKKAEESGDKNAKFKATIEAIAIIIEYIVRAFNGTLGQKMEKDGEKPAVGQEAGKSPEAAAGSPEAEAKEAVQARLKESGKPAKPENIQEASRDVQKNAAEQKEANTTEIAERQRTVEGLVEENDGLLDQQHTIEEKLNKLKGEKAEDPKIKSQKSVLEDQLANIKGKIETNDRSIKDHKAKIETLTKENEQLDAKKEAAKQIEQSMEKLKVWMPLVEKMIAVTLGLRLGAGGITFSPDGKVVIDLVIPEEQAKAMEKLQGAGAVKGEGKTVVMTQEQMVKAIAEMLPTADKPKADGVADKKPEAEKASKQEAPSKPAESTATTPGERSEKPQEIPPAKDAPVGQIRQDKDGNYWIKGENRMWQSHHNPERGQTSDSGFKSTEWSDETMDNQTAKVVEGPKAAKEKSESREGQEKLNETATKLNRLLKEAFDTGVNEKAKNASPLVRMASKMQFVVEDNKIVMTAPKAVENDLKLISTRLGYKAGADGNLIRGGGNKVEKTSDGGYKLDLRQAFGTDNIAAIEQNLKGWKALMGDAEQTNKEYGEGTKNSVEFDTKNTTDYSEADTFEPEQQKQLEELQKRLSPDMEKTDLGKVIAHVEWGTVDGKPAIRVKQEGAASFRKIYGELKSLGAVPDAATMKKGPDGDYLVQMPEGEAGQAATAKMVANLKWMQERFVEAN